MTDYTTIAESNNFIILEKYTKVQQSDTPFPLKKYTFRLRQKYVLKF